MSMRNRLRQGKAYKNRYSQMQKGIAKYRLVLIRADCSWGKQLAYPLADEAARALQCSKSRPGKAFLQLSIDFCKNYSNFNFLVFFAYICKIKDFEMPVNRKPLYLSQ
jgi:hypothetical protein